jgi:LysM repeat protein
MRWRALAFLSLGVNLVLAAVWLLFERHPLAGSLSVAGALGDSGENTTRTNFVLRRQFVTWQDLESADYPAYVTNLRSIGCPEQTIRDIIIADVNALYARKRATELVTPEQQWWRTEPDSNVVQVANEKLRALDDERKALLARLLGPNWESGDLVNLPRPTHQGVTLDGPVLGSLSADTKQAIQEVNAHSEARLQAYLDAQRQQGKTPDPVELAKLRQQTRDDLARVLSPGQLEEFLLRYSQYANNLRSEFGQLHYFNPTPDEFRAVFRATDSIDQQLELLSDSNDPNSMQARQALDTQRENAIKIALGAKRYAEYQMLHDPLYQEAVASAEDAGTPEAAATIYQIKLAASSVQQDINSDTNMTTSQKAIESKQLELDQLKADALATGQQLPADSSSQQAAPVRRTYTVRPGDTAAVVGMIYGLPESAIRAANPNVDFNRLQPGVAINIPRAGLGPIGAPRLAPVGPP